MGINSKLLSGRVPVTPYSDLPSDRYQFLGLGQAEPSLGSGTANSVLTLSTGNTRVWSNSVSLNSVTVSGGTNLGNVGNITITGGSSGYVLSTDGLGNLSWVAQSGSGNGTPGGSNTQVQFKDNGFYSIYEKFHADLKSGKIDSTKGITVEKIGGTECQKCHY